LTEFGSLASLINSMTRSAADPCGRLYCFAALGGLLWGLYLTPSESCTVPRKMTE